MSVKRGRGEKPGASDTALPPPLLILEDNPNMIRAYWRGLGIPCRAVASTGELEEALRMTWWWTGAILDVWIHSQPVGLEAVKKLQAQLPHDRWMICSGQRPPQSVPSAHFLDKKRTHRELGKRVSAWLQELSPYQDFEEITEYGPKLQWVAAITCATQTEYGLLQAATKNDTREEIASAAGLSIEALKKRKMNWEQKANAPLRPVARRIVDSEYRLPDVLPELTNEWRDRAERAPR